MSASEEAEPRRGWHEAVWQQGRRTLKEDGLGVPHRLEKGKSASEDAGPKGEWIVRSHIGWGGEQSILYKSVETSP